MSRQSHRLPAGGRLDRSEPRRFFFNGRRYEGFKGDTLASALLANGVRLVGRSFKYHRPRGILTAGSEEPNALIQLGTGAHTEPNIRATQAELYEGLTAASQNCWPSVGFDIGEINSCFSKIFPAGFYYKTFMWPASFWMKYEAVIRRAAGLGKSPTEPDPDRYDKTFAFCDVAIVGGGPAGIAAALAAGRSGARVIFCDEQAEFGGQLLADNSAEIDGKPAGEWVAGALAELAALPEVRLLARTSAWGYYDHNHLELLERCNDHLGPDAPGPRQRLWKVRARQVVLATGAIERPLVFRDNDRPGIVMASAARSYANRYGVAVGRKLVLFTNNDQAYRAAIDLKATGLDVKAIVDLRPEASGALPSQARAAGIEILAGHGVTATAGRAALTGISVMALNEAGDGVVGTARQIDCDALLMSGGWNPTVHLFSHAQGKLRWVEGMDAFVPGDPIKNCRTVGAVNGSFATGACLSQGFAAGRDAAAAAGQSGSVGAAPALTSAEPAEQPIRSLWVVPSDKPVGQAGKHFVDHQNDVTAADVGLAYREGYRSVEHLKRYTTMGMGTDQGKTSNVAALGIMAELRESAVPQIGHTTFRPPFVPVTIGAFSAFERGDLFDPIRKSPMHVWHEQHGALFENVGQWKRPWYFPKAGETMHDAVSREVKATRSSVGVVDATTLGKIDIQGPDATKLLNHVYTNAWSKLDIGKARYGLMQGEDGMVFDDGVTVRLGEHHYLMHTTTGNAARVMAWLEEWLQTEYPDWRVYCTSVTEQYATVGLNGPMARKLLAELTDDIALDDASFPFMTYKEGHVAGIPARVIRISFTGELTFEINVASSYGLALWEAVMAAGEKYAITPYGTEAMHVLRAEKGFVIVGQETDATVTPQDLGMDWIVSKQKGDFIGRRSYSRPDTARPDRKHLVGLLTENPQEVLPEGGQIVAELQKKPPMAMLGHVTSSYFSPNLDRSIAMALVKNGRNRIGETVYIPLVDRTVRATVTEPRFFDLEGKRLNG